jgi:FkbM family methyltransferase
MAEHISKKYIATFLPPNPIVVEAGAHKGVDTIAMAVLWPHGVIHAFEPLPDVFALLKKRTAEFANVRCYQLALSETSGKATLYKIGQRTPASSLLEPNQLGLYPGEIIEPITVDTITLDDWYLVYKVPTIDFLWLDLQGFELAVLKASPKILSAVKVIHTEVNLIERYKHMPLYAEVRTWLEAHGFHVQHEAIGKKKWGNVLFVRR